MKSATGPDCATGPAPKTPRARGYRSLDRDQVRTRHVEHVARGGSAAATPRRPSHGVVGRRPTPPSDRRAGSAGSSETDRATISPTWTRRSLATIARQHRDGRRHRRGRWPGCSVVSFGRAGGGAARSRSRRRPRRSRCAPSGCRSTTRGVRSTTVTPHGGRELPLHPRRMQPRIAATRAGDLVGVDPQQRRARAGTSASIAHLLRGHHDQHRRSATVRTESGPECRPGRDGQHACSTLQAAIRPRATGRAQPLARPAPCAWLRAWLLRS